MVTSRKMKGTEISYRGSKSITNQYMTLYHKFVIVKEQRIDGSLEGVNTSCLRFILMGPEKDYQTRILSKLRNIHIKRFYSSKKVFNQSDREKHNMPAAMDP